MQIEVTQEDINSGIATDCKRCPVAIAILRHFPDATAVHVGVFKIYIGYPDKSRAKASYFTPDKAADFIWSFDMGERVYPFTFELQ